MKTRSLAGFLLFGQSRITRLQADRSVSAASKTGRFEYVNPNEFGGNYPANSKHCDRISTGCPQLPVLIRGTILSSRKLKIYF
jgi:hypothetical protein